MKIKTASWKLASAVGVISFLMGVGWYRFGVAPQVPLSADETVALAEPTEESYPHLIPPKSTLYNVLRDLNVSSPTIQQIVDGAKPIMNLGRLRAGTQFRLMHLTDPLSEVVGVEFLLSPIEKIEVKKTEGQWVARKITETVQTKVVTFRGVVTSSLWESAELAQMDPNLIVQLAEIFAWQVDFAREVRVNDRWRLSVERNYVNGKPFGWGSIVAAEYENAGQKHNAVLFSYADEKSGYFAADGASLKRMFLKSPIRYGRISSRFKMRRFHPILKINRPHLGVDYAAPTGTPVRAVGDGLVAVAGWNGGGGRTIKLRHNSSYQTAYLHLSRFESGIRPGVRVQQGQVIGYVGTTGLSTGPHLHFEFVYNGRVVDPLGQKFPSADPVPSSLMAKFQTQSAQLLAALPAWDGVAVTSRDPLPREVRRGTVADPETALAEP